MRNTKRIDIHHHIIPAQYRDALGRIGIGSSGGLVLADWSPEASLEHMDALGVEAAICSISEPALYPFVARDLGYAKSLARQLNEYMAGLRDQYGKRFGAFAVLPMPDVEASLEELAYALDVLHLEGIGLLSNYGGSYLGDRVFEPIFQALEARGACVYIHPSVAPPPSVMPRPEFLPLDYFAEFCFNTTRAAGNMVFGGTMERCPNIKPILSHMGGALPYLAWRLSICFPDMDSAVTNMQMPDYVNKGWESLTKPVDEYWGQFYFDTALATHQTAFEAVDRMAPGHVLFGSDAFYADIGTAKDFVSDIEAYYVDDEQLDALSRLNAYKLFPQLQQ